MAVSLSAQQVNRLRLRAQRLHPDEASTLTNPLAAVQALFAAQAQELNAGMLSLRPRSRGLTAAQLEQARLVEKSLFWTWSLRGTLHLVTAADATWLVPLLGPRLVQGGHGRMRQLGWDEENYSRAAALLERALGGGKTLPRAALVELLAQNDLPREGQAPVHLLYRMSLEGRLCTLGELGKKPVYGLWAEHYPSPNPLPRPEGLALLARRYLAAYAPAAPADFAAWAGLPLGDARAAYEAISGDLVEVMISKQATGKSVEQTASQPAWLLRDQLAWLDQPEPDVPVVRLLPRWDTYLLGYAKRDLAIDPAHFQRIVNGGVIYPVLLADGRVLGTWQTERRAGTRQVTIAPFQPLPEEILPLIDAEANDISRFLSETGPTRVEIQPYSALP
jgi:hypothetical protein